MNESRGPDRNHIEELQLVQLNRLLAELLESNPFYSPRLCAAGFQRGVNSLDEFFRQMPFTTKHELTLNQRDHPPFGTNLTYPLERYTRFSQTSGTTGAPLRWLDTPEGWSGLVRNWGDVFRAAGVHAADRVLFAFSFGPFLGFWTAFEAGEQIGCLCIPGGGMSSSSRLRTILECGVTVLCCTPTYALRLGEVAAEEQFDLARANVRLILVAGEAGGSIPATRARIESVWCGARVFDHHGMTEVGPVSFESPDHPCVLHVIERAYLAEVIQPETGEPILEGETGELVLTTLLRTGSPLLRYRTGDLVKPAWSKAEIYGRPELALEGGILGRSDDMVVIRGVNVPPSAVEGILRRHPEVTEYRVEIQDHRGLYEMRILVEPVSSEVDTEHLRRIVEGDFRQTFNLRVPVSVVPCGGLPRYEMKSRRWVRNPQYWDHDE